MRPFRLYHICRRKSNNSDIYTKFQRKLCEHYRKNARITFVRTCSEISGHFWSNKTKKTYLKVLPGDFLEICANKQIHFIYIVEI